MRYLLLLGVMTALSPFALRAHMASAMKPQSFVERIESACGIAVPVLHAVNADDVGPGSEITRNNSLPSRIFLDQNYPNPFNPSTTIRFGLPEGSYVRLTIHTLLGNQVKVVIDSWQDPGVYTLNLAANDLPSGVYFYRLQTDFGSLTRRMTIQK